MITLIIKLSFGREWTASVGEGDEQFEVSGRSPFEATKGLVEALRDVGALADKETVKCNNCGSRKY